MCSLGSIDVIKLIKIKVPPVNKTIPNLLVNWNERVKRNAPMNGKAIVARTAPKVGFGLNLKYSVFENGKDSM